MEVAAEEQVEQASQRDALIHAASEQRSADIELLLEQIRERGGLQDDAESWPRPLRSHGDRSGGRAASG